MLFEVEVKFCDSVSYQYYFLQQMISLLPSKIMKLLEFVGFSGDKVWAHIIKATNFLQYP